MRPMSTFQFDHIHLFTRDPEATAAFYERMFGAEVIRSMPQGKPRIDLKLGGANIFILDVSQDAKAVAGPSHPHQGLDHFGLEVKDLDKTCAELKAKGAVFTREPQTIRPGTRIAFLTGPEGVSIELLERTAV
jgi:catechol 2,3-dioxygenase-like lactoylglutathione lyase family enzyme